MIRSKFSINTYRKLWKRLCCVSCFCASSAFLAINGAACIIEPGDPESDDPTEYAESSVGETDESDGADVEQRIAVWRNDQNGIIVPGQGSWGTWQQTVYCNDGMWAVGYKMRVETSQGGGVSGGNDDTALNSVQLSCKNPATGSTEWISSYDGIWGSWYGAASCPGSNNYLKTARMRIESSQGGGDDTAANSVEFGCSQGGTILAPGGQGWGSWGNWVQCPNNTAICGLKTRFESSQGSGDDTAMNGLELACCDLP